MLVWHNNLVDFDFMYLCIFFIVVIAYENDYFVTITKDGFLEIRIKQLSFCLCSVGVAR